MVIWTYLLNVFIISKKPILMDRNILKNIHFHLEIILVDFLLFKLSVKLIPILKNLIPFYFLKDLFIFYLREWVRKKASEGRATGRESSSRLPTECGAQCAARSHDPWDHDLRWNQELDAQPTEPPKRPLKIYHF